MLGGLTRTVCWDRFECKAIGLAKLVQGREMKTFTTTPSQVTDFREKSVFRLIIFDSQGTVVLLESRGSEYFLPKIEIPQFTRPAQEITELLRISWSVSSVLLFFGLFDAATAYFAVLESQ